MNSEQRESERSDDALGATGDLGDTSSLPVINAEGAADAPEPETVGEEAEAEPMAEDEAAETVAVAEVAEAEPVAEAKEADDPETEGAELLEAMPKAVQHSRSRAVPVLIGLAVCAVVGGLVAAILLLPGYGGDVERVDAQESISAVEAVGNAQQQLFEVTIPITAPGLDANGSRIPMRVSGKDANGAKRSEVSYASFEGKMRLPEGTYSLRVAETPISAIGVVYDLPIEEITIRVKGGGKASIDPKDAKLVLTPMHAESINDAKLKAARELILADPEKKKLAKKLAKLVVARRKQAVAAVANRRNNMFQDHERPEEEEEEEEKEGEDSKDGSGNDGGNAPSGASQSTSSNSGSKDSGGKESSGSSDNGSSGDTGGGQAPDAGGDQGQEQPQEGSGGSDAGQGTDGGGQTPDAGGSDTGGGSEAPAPAPEQGSGEASTPQDAQE